MSKTDPRLLSDLEARGLIHDTTDRAALQARLEEGPITVYAGFDPTASSLHAGNMVGLMLLRRFQEAGHKPISLAGGATGMIGDPSGRSDERALQDDESLAANLAGIVPQLRQFLDFDRPGNPAKLLDNRAWTVGVPYLTFLRDVGKHITVNQMISKDSVRSRLEGSDGISYTEFSYMLLQAHDFAWMYENEDVQMQTGGSDQWGNITAGTDLIRKKLGGSAFALTHPLLTKSDGTKYGKTAGGDTMWLSAEKMSPYRFYQAWLQSEDSDIRKLLAMLTLLPMSEVDAVAAEHDAEPHRRVGQRRVAQEVTTLVHGGEATTMAIAASAAVFGGPVGELDLATLEMLQIEMPLTTISASELGVDGNLIRLLQGAELVSSKGEANRLLKQNGVSINDAKVTPDTVIGVDHLLHHRFFIIRKGKKQLVLVRLEG